MIHTQNQKKRLKTMSKFFMYGTELQVNHIGMGVSEK